MSSSFELKRQGRKGDMSMKTHYNTETVLSLMFFFVTGFGTTTWIRRVRRMQQSICRSSSTNSATTTTTTAYTKQDVMELRKKHLMKCVSVSYSNSGGLMIMRGNGSKLFDENGVSYLDTRNNVCHVGHCHPKVVQAVIDQVSMLNTNTRYLHPNVCYLAERICNKCPDPLNVVVFVNSGSEANDLALRLARAYTKSKNTIVVDGGYHGHTLSVLEISPYKYEHSKEFDLTEQPGSTMRYKTPAKYVWKVPCPDTYRGPHRGNHAGNEYAKYIQEACEYYRSINETVGAFIMEGGMSVGGVILPPDDFVRQSVQFVREAGGVYIADEVQTGFGRLGSTFWAFEHGNHGIVPDVVTIGKPFGNGMSLAAVITTREIANAFEDMGVEYFNTFGGNPVCAAAGLAVLDVLEEESLQQHALEVGNYLKEQFWKLQKEQLKRDIIGDIRGSGLFLGIELVRPGSMEPATEETSYLCTLLKQKFYILTSIDGKHDNVLVIKPPLVFSKADADLLVDAFGKAAVELQEIGESALSSMAKTPT